MVPLCLAASPGGLGHHHVVELEFPVALGASEFVAVSPSHRAVGPLFEDVDAVSGHFVSRPEIGFWLGWFPISSLWCALVCDEKRGFIVVGAI